MNVHPDSQPPIAEPPRICPPRIYTGQPPPRIQPAVRSRKHFWIVIAVLATAGFLVLAVGIVGVFVVSHRSHSRGNSTPFHRAVRKGDIDQVRAALRANPELARAKDTDRDNSTALGQAIHSGQFDLVELLLDYGAEINGTDRSGHSPLHLATEMGRKDLVELLLARQANIEARTLKGETALHIAARRNQFKVARVLLESHANPQAQDYLGRVPLQFARDKRVAALLKEHGATGSTPFATRADAETLLDAISAGHEEKVQAILQENPDYANAEQDWVNHWTVLHTAAAEGRATITEMLLNAGANINARNKEGETPLFWAVRKCHAHVVEVLLAQNADINAAESNNLRTPLHEAVLHGHREITGMLQAKGADLALKDKLGRTPLTIAVELGHTEIADLLRGTKMNE